jgi:hypothetical protein
VFHANLTNFRSSEISHLNHKSKNSDKKGAPGEKVVENVEIGDVPPFPGDGVVVVCQSAGGSTKPLFYCCYQDPRGFGHISQIDKTLSRRFIS